MVRYDRNTSIDGHPITKNGEPMSKAEVIAELNCLAGTIAWLKNEYWALSNNSVKNSDRIIEECTRVIGKSN